MNDLKEVLNDLLARFEHLAQTKTVVGEPMDIKGKTLVPLIEVDIGAGGGGGSGETGKSDDRGSGVGSGGGIKVKPVAVLLIDESGMSAYGLEKKSAMSKIADEIPEIIEKMSKSKEK